MAVLDYHPGISVTIINHEGHELIEHPEIDQQQIDQNNGVARYLALRTVTSYIVAEDDANFGVKVKSHLASVPHPMNSLPRSEITELIPPLVNRCQSGRHTEWTARSWASKSGLMDS